jgi:TatD DNase family protein
MEHADFLAELAAAGRIDVVGEAGFDFFGDRPDRVRGAETEASQRRAFEFQLELAIDRGLPLLLHVRKGMDLVFGYSKRLKLLPAAIFHSWSGTPGEAEAFLRRGIRAYFSFGSTVLNGHKRAIESLRTIPDSAILSETDAPWQPPKGSPFCRFEDIGRVIAGMATIRQTGVEPLMVLIEHNWDSIFGTAPERYGDARHEDAKSPGQGRAGDRSADHGPGGA